LKLTKARMLSFFRTPDFEVELNEGSITIHIHHPQNVDSSMMRNIEKVYSIFRQRLNPPRTPWGKRTGIRQEKKEMYKLVQDLFCKMRKETPLKVPDIFDEIRKGGISLSDESLKRIVYGLKKKR